MKKLFLLLAISSVSLTSCVESSSRNTIEKAIMLSDADTIIIVDKCIVDSCIKIVPDTFNYIDCSGNITKKYDLDTIKVPLCNYIFYKRIGKTEIEKEAVTKNIFEIAHKGDTTSLHKLWQTSLPKID